MSQKCDGTRIRIRWRRENLKDLPYKVLAMTAEGWLLKETRHETVILDHVDILFLQGSFSSSNFLSECGVCIAGPEGILARVVCFLIVRHRALHLSILLQTDQGEIPCDTLLLSFCWFFSSQSKDARAYTNPTLGKGEKRAMSERANRDALGNARKRKRKREEKVTEKKEKK